MNTALRKIKFILLILLLVGIWTSIDLGCNFFYSLIPEINDGITICGFWAPLLLPDHGWSRVLYLELFRNALCFTALIGSTVIGIDIYVLISKQKKE